MIGNLAGEKAETSKVASCHSDKQQFLCAWTLAYFSWLEQQFLFSPIIKSVYDAIACV